MPIVTELDRLLIDPQKIDKIKSQLMTLADLLKPGSLEHGGATDELDEEELQILSDAGIISGSSQAKPSRRRSQHIVFVDNEEQGMLFLVTFASNQILIENLCSTELSASENHG